jgi:predicted Zn-dependent protease
MKKTILQGAIIVVLFVSAFFALSRIDWMKIFKVQQVTDQTEEKLGDLFWNVFEKSGKEVKDVYVVNAIDSIITKICQANDIDRKKLKPHVLASDEINAFALPNGHLVINTALIFESDHQDELAGVIAHELAHIELNHVMKKLVKEIGLSVLISMTTGSNGAETIKEAARMLSSSAFDRKLEKDADIKAVEYLVNAQVNPEKFAEFLYKFAEGEQDNLALLTWISSHPDSKLRAEYIIEQSKKKSESYQFIISDVTWHRLKQQVKP